MRLCRDSKIRLLGFIMLLYLELGLLWLPSVSLFQQRIVMLLPGTTHVHLH